MSTDTRTTPAVATDLQKGDRITLLTGEHTEYAVQVSHLPASDDRLPMWAPPRPTADAVFVTGYFLQADGTAYVQGHTSAWLHGPAGTTWARWEDRKPANIGRPPTRHRLLCAEGDGEPITRRARVYDAVATIWVADDTTGEATMNDSRSLRLAAFADGSWRLAVRGAWTPGDREHAGVTVAAGHIDDEPGTVHDPYGADAVNALDEPTARTLHELLSRRFAADALAGFPDMIREEFTKGIDRDVEWARGVVAVRFGTTDEWDDGYHYTASDAVAVLADGTTDTVNFTSVDVTQELDELSDTARANGGLTSESVLVVNLATDTVEHA